MGTLQVRTYRFHFAEQHTNTTTTPPLPSPPKSEKRILISAIFSPVPWVAINLNQIGNARGPRLDPHADLRANFIITNVED